MDYDAGERETGLDKELVRAVGGSGSPGRRSAAADLREGDRCEGNYGGRGREYPGKISRVRFNGTVDVDYDDGEKETGLDKGSVHGVGGSGSTDRRPADD